MNINSNLVFYGKISSATRILHGSRTRKRLPDLRQPFAVYEEEAGWECGKPGSGGVLLLRVEAGWLSREIDEDVLHLRVVLKDDFVRLASDTGLLVAAERRAFGNLVVGVDPDAARLDGVGDTEGAVDILCPDSAAKAVIAVIGHLDHFFFCLEFDDNGDGAEDLFTSNAHIVRNIGDECRLHEDAVFERTVSCLFTAAGDGRTFFFREFDIGENLIELGFIDCRTELRVFLPRQANLDFIEAVDELCHKFVIDILLDEDARTRAADLSLIEEDAADLPPSSSVAGMSFSAAALATERPTSVEPVNASLQKPLWSSMY